VTNLPLLTALVAGFAHALEADHMAAVTTFVARRPHPMRAAGFGVRWGIGHSLALLAAGGGLILLDLRVPAELARGLEFAVGAMLLGLGAWALLEGAHRRSLGREHARAHAAGHSHAHPTTWVGAAHGLAGTAGFLALVPAAMIASPWLAGGYLLCFGLGTVAAMGLYGLLAGAVFHRAGTLALPLGASLRVATALASSTIGILWMHGAITG
jgi:hypothetical protein